MFKKIAKTGAPKASFSIKWTIEKQTTHSHFLRWLYPDQVIRDSLSQNCLYKAISAPLVLERVHLISSIVFLAIMGFCGKPC
jgi:hypothetical protein